MGTQSALGVLRSELEKEGLQLRTIQTYVQVAGQLLRGAMVTKTRSRWCQASAVLKRLWKLGIISHGDWLGVPERAPGRKDKTDSRIQASLIRDDLDFTTMLEACSSPDAKVAMQLAYYCGLRRAECASASRANVISGAKGQKKLIVRGAKGGGERVVPIPSWLVDALPEKMSLTPGKLSQEFRKVARKTKRPNHFHGLRHSYATRRLESGALLPNVQKWLGHKDLATTSIYLHVLDDNDPSIEKLGY